jgi:hypothetical protein
MQNKLKHLPSYGVYLDMKNVFLPEDGSNYGAKQRYKIAMFRNKLFN